MVYHIFNASHYEALANGGCNFTPPAAARRIDTDLAVLPYWYARPGEAVLVPEVALAENFVSSLPVGRGVAFAGDVSGSTQVTVEPWGWNKALVRTLVKRGVPRDVMPGDEFLDNLRRLQNRKTSSNLLKSLRGELDELLPGEASSMLAGTSYFVDDCKCLHGLKPFLSGSCMLKKPWSGSGRGLRQGFGRLDEALAGWVRRVLSRQGGLSVEPFLTKRCDLALEFEAHPGGQWDYVGPSVFVTDATGRYAGSLVAPDDVLLRAIDRQVDLRLVDEARRLVEQLLPRLAEGYTGPVGVDMMVVEGKRGEAALHPCVEVNLRRTMGRVALDLRRHLAAGLTARFVLARPRIGTPAPMWHGDRLVGGSLPLVPVGATTSVAAYLDVADGSRGNWSAMM